MLPVIVSVLAVVLALVLVGILVRRHIPEAGLMAWLKESFASTSAREELAAMREESARLAEPSPETGDIRVGQLFEDISEPGEAYHQPVDLRHLVSRRHG